MDETWRELAQVSSWQHPTRLVTQYQVSVPVSVLEVLDKSKEEIRELILQRMTQMLNGHLVG